MRQTLTLRHYRLYVLGNITSNLGMWTQRVAMGWLTWELTHSTTWLGINAVAEAGRVEVQPAAQRAEPRHAMR